MSGGLAFVLDESGQDEFARHCNTTLVELHPVERADEMVLRRLVEQHARYTRSARARSLLARWDSALRDFVAVIPTEYRRALAQRNDRQMQALRSTQADTQAARTEGQRRG
jgi:glutamate synthase domain-containing protein 3